MNPLEKKLLRSVKRNDLIGIKEILELKVNNKNLNGSSSRSKYVIKNNGNNSKLKNELNINCREDKFQMTPLMIASLKGSMDIVQYLIEKGAHVGLKDIKGNTALQLACMKQRFHIIDTLINKKSNQNELNLNGWNCLLSAVNYFHDDNSMMLLLLLQTGARTEQKDNNGLTCIDHAVRKNKINCLRVLLNFNPKLILNSSRALINASIKANLEMVILLLNFGVDPNKIDETNGSASLHEALRINETKEEKFLLRLKVVKNLILFGASTQLRNHRNETPLEIIFSKPKEIEKIYIDAIEHFLSQPNLIPKNNMLQNLDIKLPKHPLLKPNINWTRNEPRYYSGYKSEKNLENSRNLLDGDTHSMCSFPAKAFNWIIFDMKSEHSISRVRIYAWKNKEMPKECYLQISNSIDGPWCCVHTFLCEMVGSSVRSNAGVPLDFGGFEVRSRYWRLVIANNHGGEMTSFHGIEFFGFDCRISKFLSELNLSEYEDLLIENNLNQMDSIFNCTFDQFDELKIENLMDKKKLWDFIVDMQIKVQSIKKLEWFNEPITFGLVGKSLPPFSIIANSIFIDSLQLISHGGGILNGELCVEMDPIKINNESSSIAIFRNIYFSSPGKFILEAKCPANPNICISSQAIQIFELNDPEYYRLLNAYPESNRINPKFGKEKKLLGQIFEQNIETDEDGLIEQQIDYDFPDFSSFNTNSKMKIKDWITESQQLNNTNEKDDETTSTSSFRLIKKVSNNSFINDEKNLNSNPLLNEIEYETQSITIDLLDETISISSGDYNQTKQESEIVKTEAKALVKMESNFNQSKKESSKTNGLFGIDDNSRNSKNQIKASVSRSSNNPLQPPPPPPPPLAQLKLDEGLLKFQKKKTDKEKIENSLDAELKSRIAHLGEKMNISKKDGKRDESEKFSLRAKKALEKYKNL